MIKAINVLGMWLLLAGCDDRVKGTPEVSVDRGIDDLPHLSDKGRRIPYLRYRDTKASSGNGHVFFLYPMMDQKNELLSLVYNPLNDDINGLFAEDVIGISGPVSNENGVLRIQFLPISIPIGITSGQKWRLRYAKRDFACLSRPAVMRYPSARKLAVSCSNGQYTLSFVFDRDVGVEEYQDFCGKVICTYKLIDKEGLLSGDLLDYMGLPRI